MSEQVVTYELDGGVAKVGLKRPAKRNALSSALQEQLEEAVNRANKEARVGLLFSHSEHFCAGLDLKEAMTWMNDPMAHLEIRVGCAAKARPFDWLARGRSRIIPTRMDFSSKVSSIMRSRVRNRLTV